VSEVVRDALPAIEERKSKLEVLRTYLAQDSEQARAGGFVDDFSMEILINDLDSEAQCLRFILRQGRETI